MVGLLASACAFDNRAAVSTLQKQIVSTARLVDPAEFAAAVAEPDRVTLNVHAPFEGNIAGTDVSILFDQIAEQTHRLPPIALRLWPSIADQDR